MADSTDTTLETVPTGAEERSGGINQGAPPADETPEQAAVRAARMRRGDMVDDNAASHQGGIGAQGGQADYGSAGNLAGMDQAGSPGGTPH